MKQMKIQNKKVQCAREAPNIVVMEVTAKFRKILHKKDLTKICYFQGHRFHGQEKRNRLFFFQRGKANTATFVDMDSVNPNASRCANL